MNTRNTRNSRGFVEIPGFVFGIRIFLEHVRVSGRESAQGSATAYAEGHTCDAARPEGGLVSVLDPENPFSANHLCA